MQIVAENLTKAFYPNKALFKGLCFSIHNAEPIAVIGRNGKGKSTLLQLIANLSSPSSGSVNILNASGELIDRDYQDYINYLAPYIKLYEEFSPIEHIAITARLRNEKYSNDNFTHLLSEFGLDNAINREISKFSSGMKQRMKYVLAFSYPKPILLLDEPFTNLDVEGIKIVEKYMSNHVENEGILVIASNDKNEYKICNQFIDLDIQ